MSYSLLDFKIPKNWIHQPNADKEFNDECIQEAIKCGVHDKENKKHLVYAHHNIDLVAHFFPFFNRDQLKMCGIYIHWIFMVDDYLEDEINISDEKQYEIVRNYEHLLLTGEYKNKDIPPTGLEKFTKYVRDEAFKWANFENGRIGIFNIFINETIQWLYSIIPLNKTKESSKPIHFELYYFIRKINVGGILCAVAMILVTPQIKLDMSAIWLNPIFRRMVERMGMHISMVNDCASYAKEIENKSYFWNPLYFLQKRNDWTFEKTFKLLVNTGNEYVDQHISDKQLLLSTLLNQQHFSQQQLDEVKFLSDGIAGLFVGNYTWSLVTKRYTNENSPFIEIKMQKDQFIDIYDNVLHKDNLLLNINK